MRSFVEKLRGSTLRMTILLVVGYIILRKLVVGYMSGLYYFGGAVFVLVVGDAVCAGVRGGGEVGGDYFALD